MFISHFVVADSCPHRAAGPPQAVGDGTGGLPRQRCLSEHPEDAGPLFGLNMSNFISLSVSMFCGVVPKMLGFDSLHVFIHRRTHKYL